MKPRTDETGVGQLAEKFDQALERLAKARPFTKRTHQRPVLDLARQLLLEPGGIEALAARAPRFDAAGVFAGTDWDEPGALLPGLVGQTLAAGEPATVVLECLSELRLLALARGDARHAGIPPEQARHFLTQVLALNLSRIFGNADESDRERLGPLVDAVSRLFHHLLEDIGFEDILGSLIDEIWRILTQRPIQVGHVKAMIGQIAITLASGNTDIGEARLGADRLVSALFGPTQACVDDPGIAAFVDRLVAMDAQSLQREAHGFARAMHDTGLVSDYHAVYLRWINAEGYSEFIGDALGLSTTGLDALRCFPALVQRIISDAIHPETAQAVFGLAMLLERGLLYQAPIAPGLWRQVNLELSGHAATILAGLYGDAHPPRVFLLAGVISLLGQPLGVGQGNNPTCQSARALSMWSLNDPDFLLHLIAQTLRTDSITMHFEGQELVSSELPAGLASLHPLDTDPVSTLMVPHLDRIYVAMGRLCEERDEDPHRWINPEFHGWWVGREFAIAVDIHTGHLQAYEQFVERFYGYYHPYYNGLTPVIHPQPAGLAITDSSGTFVGWHAITILRVALDQEDVMRVYFYNPNNDSGQHWGDDVIVSTQGHGERHGEASLPFPQLASRLYIFHYDSTVSPTMSEVPEEEVEAVMAMARRTWAADRIPPEAEDAEA
ncbi:MAG: hypothetical protein U5R48_10530 [Gammaproteobacteria bacterium]|nr:hypothetical protein [Gammaproteobacteria bacterium]